MSILDKFRNQINSQKNVQFMPSVENNAAYDGMEGMPVDPFMMGGGMGMGAYPSFNNYNEQPTNTTLAQVTLDNEIIIEQFKSYLRGYYIKKTYNPITKKEEEKKVLFGAKFCSDEGINTLVGDLTMYLSKTIVLSNIPDKDKKMINTMTKLAGIDIVAKIAMNTRKWSVNRTMRSSVVNIMTDLIWTNFMRSLNAGERTGLYGTMKTINTNVTQQMPMQDKKSLFGL